MRRFRSRQILDALTLALVLVITAESAVIATSFVRSGKAVKAMKVATDDAIVITTSTTWSDVPGMSFSTTVPSGEQGLFLATFSAHGQCLTTATAQRMCEIRVLIDGLVVVPGSVSDGVTFEVVIPQQTLEGMRSMQFLAGPFGPGSHDWVVQCRVNGNQTSFALFERTFSVLRSKV